jgi:hypothetical protein
MRLETAEKTLTKVGDLESAIISAHKKYFGTYSEFQRTSMEQTTLYDALKIYFKANH